MTNCEVIRGQTLKIGGWPELERTRGAQFDWVVRVRPDMEMLFPLDDIRTYDQTAVHVLTNLARDGPLQRGRAIHPGQKFAKGGHGPFL